MMTEPGVYTSISVSDEQAEAAQAIAVDYTSKHQYSNQAYDLTWSDSFYDNNEDEEEAVVDDVIAVFDVDYTQMRKTLRRQQWHYLFAMISSVIMFGDALFHKDNLLGGGFIFKILWLYGGVSYVGVTVFMAYMVRKAQRELVESEFGMHVAVTREGIRKDLGSSISHTTTVVLPFDDIEAISFESTWLGLSCCFSRTTRSVMVTPKNEAKNKDGKQFAFKPVLHGIVEAEALVDLVQKMMADPPLLAVAEITKKEIA